MRTALTIILIIELLVLVYLVVAERPGTPYKSTNRPVFLNPDPIEALEQSPTPKPWFDPRDLPNLERSGED